MSKNNDKIGITADILGKMGFAGVCVHILAKLHHIMPKNENMADVYVDNPELVNAVGIGGLGFATAAGITIMLGKYLKKYPEQAEKIKKMFTRKIVD